MVERHHEELFERHRADGGAQLVEAVEVAAGLDGVGDVYDHVQIAHAHRRGRVPSDGLDHVGGQVGVRALELGRGRGAVQQARHRVQHVRVHVHAQRASALADLVVAVLLVPIVQQAGQARLAHVDAVRLGQRRGRLRHASRMLEPLGLQPFLQIALARIEERIRKHVLAHRTPPS